MLLMRLVLRKLLLRRKALLAEVMLGHELVVWHLRLLRRNMHPRIIRRNALGRIVPPRRVLRNLLIMAILISPTPSGLHLYLLVRNEKTPLPDAPMKVLTNKGIKRDEQSDLCVMIYNVWTS